MKIPLSILGKCLCDECKQHFHKAMVIFGASEQLTKSSEKTEIDFKACADCENRIKLELGPRFNDFKKEQS